jgi:sugar lactone lactonase YvrE
MSALKPFAPGDIFVTASDLDESARHPTGKGKILQIASDWTPKATFETGHTGLIASLTLDPQGNLHALDPQARKITSIGPDGQPKAMLGKLPERGYGSMIVLSDGNFLIGEHLVGQVPGFSGDGKVYRVAPDGDVLATYDTETNGGMGGFLGVTHMALSADGKTLYHLSETGPHVYGHDLAANKRLGAIYTRADPPPMVFGIAGQADGSILMAAGNGVRQLSAKGEVMRQYDMPEGRGWAVLKLRGDGARFWALDFFGGKVASVETASGKLLELKELGLAKCLAGIAEVPNP